MARVDKTESAVGVVRGILAADLDPAIFDKVRAVGFNAVGRVVLGAGQSGVKGVIVPGIYGQTKAGQAIDVFVLADIEDVEGLAAGTSYFAAAADGVISTTNTGTPIGFTVEADRLIVRL